MTEDQRELLRRELLRLLKRSAPLAMRDDTLLSTLAIHPHLAALKPRSLQHQLNLLLTHGLITATPIPLNAGRYHYALTEDGHAHILEHAIS